MMIGNLAQTYRAHVAMASASEVRRLPRPLAAANTSYVLVPDLSLEDMIESY